ncbi:hypothetical protein [Paenibacillus sp. Y412MC10]|uniref:hypothetical protein n=1 Tax=Geobacillus sp. (strain Y412MC10) TaxID=481743 RepID=UPI0011A6F28E|nr:hypothetical protein [Paenibacillus sp. Y412MC10]
MPNFLVDTQVSQNASTAGPIAVPVGPVLDILAPPTSALFGTLGLNTSTAGTDTPYFVMNWQSVGGK